MKIKTNIILNKADIASQKIIEDISQKHKAKIIARIPYLKKIQEQYSKGKPIDNQAISEIINNLNK